MGVAVERREAPGPTSLGSRVSKRRAWVTRLCRRRAAGRVMVRQGGLAHPLAPSGAPSPRVEDGKKGQGGPAVVSQFDCGSRPAPNLTISMGDVGYRLYSQKEATMLIRLAHGYFFLWQY